MTGDSISRRRVLQGAASAATLAGVGVAIGPMIGRAAQVNAAEVPIRMAMHIHASFSEGTASMQAHLAEAERTGVDVIWWTEHEPPHGRAQLPHRCSLRRNDGVVRWCQRDVAAVELGVTFATADAVDRDAACLRD